MTPPPLLLALAYRLLGWRLGPAYREWVHDDLTRRGWLVRQGAPVLLALLVLGVLIDAVVGSTGDRLVPLLVVLTGVGLFMRRSIHVRALRQQGIDAAGNPAAPWYADERARRQRNVVGGLSTVVLVIAGLTILALRSS
ncbi:MAG TPA: hypothetical protein VL281_03595 [Mycobacteriales bacterium]|nr:hypothetical protein [Mycobacteriales bacterium]